MSKASGFDYNYDRHKEELVIRTASGREYKYYDVPRGEVADMLTDHAPTRYFNKNIKDRYEWDRGNYSRSSSYDDFDDEYDYSESDGDYSSEYNGSSIDWMPIIIRIWAVGMLAATLFFGIKSGWVDTVVGWREASGGFVDFLTYLFVIILVIAPIALGIFLTIGLELEWPQGLLGGAAFWLAITSLPLFIGAGESIDGLWGFTSLAFSAYFIYKTVAFDETESILGFEI